MKKTITTILATIVVIGGVIGFYLESNKDHCNVCGEEYLKINNCDQYQGYNLGVDDNCLGWLKGKGIDLSDSREVEKFF